MQNNPIWKSNFLALKEKDPELAQHLLETNISSRQFSIPRVTEGLPLLTVHHPNGSQIPLGDPTHPAREAENWAAKLGESCLHNAHVMLIGFGAGYHLHALFNQSDANTLIWVVEPHLSILKAAFHCMDFSSLIRSSRIQFASGMPPSEVAKRLFTGDHSLRIRAQGIQFVYSKFTAPFHAEYISELKKSVGEAIRMDVTEIHTAGVQGPAILQNIIDNLPYVFQGAPVLRLLGAASGLPAIIVGPGPSLEQALPLLPKIHPRALIITIDTAYRILLRNQIPSDLVVSLDFTELNAGHFDQTDKNESILVAYPGIHPSIAEQFAGRSYFYVHRSTRLLQTLTSLGPLGELISDGSTAHAAYHLARLMGCSPIVLAGNDLAFSPAGQYAPGAMQMERTRSNPTECLKIPSNDGGLVETNLLYKKYLDYFSDLIRSTSGLVINTSFHGARISGCPYQSIEEVMNSLPSHEIDKDFLVQKMTPSLENQRSRTLNEIRKIRSLCMESLPPLKQLREQAERLNPPNKEFPLHAEQIMNSFSILLHKTPELYRMCLPLCTQSTIEMLGTGANHITRHSGSFRTNEVLKLRCLKFLNDFVNAFERHIEILGKAFFNPNQCS